MGKTFDAAMAAIEDIRDGATLMLGGFGLCGIPENLILALREKGVKDLTCISNNAGVDDWGIGLLLQTRQVRKMISTYVGENAIFERQVLSGEIEIELVPQGTLSERIRARGAGIPAFYTPTTYGTQLAEGKPVAEFDGRHYVQERWLKADAALIKAELADSKGNLTYRKAARNFSPLMATAAEVTIVQARKVVEARGIDPEQVITPGIFVNRIVEVADAKQEEALLRAEAN